MTPDWTQILDRIKAERAEHADDQPETPPETVDQITRRMYHGDDLPDIADRMFRL